MSKARILVVEDEWLVAQGIAESLGELGYEVVGLAASGEETLRLAAEAHPDLVLMDILLQGDMDGIEAAEHLRRRFDLPVVFLTAYADPQTLGRAKVTEPYGYLLKPFEVRELHSIIEIALYKARAEKRLQHLHQILHAIRNVNQLITTEKDRRRLIEQACRLLAEGRGYFTAWIALLNEQGQVTAAAVAGEDYISDQVLAMLQQGNLPPCGREALNHSHLVIFENLAQDCSECAWGQNLHDRGALVTRLSHRRQCYGLLGVQLPAALARDEEEISLFNELVADLSLALYKMDLEDREQQALGALQDSEARYRSLVENLPVGIYQRTMGEDNRMLVVNPALKAMHGFDSLEDWPSSSTAATYADPRQRRRFNEQLVIKGRVDGMELDLLRKDGTSFVGRVWAHVQAAGDPPLVEGVVIDITAQKQAEAALIQAKENWEQTFDTIPDFIAILDAEHRIVQVNRAMADCLKASPGQCVGLQCHQAVHGLDHPPDYCPHSLALNDGKTHEAEIHEKDLGGDFLVTCSPLQDADGKVIGAVHVARNITEQKRVEKELDQYRSHLEQLVSERTAALLEVNTQLNQEIAKHEQTGKARRESEARFRAIFEEAPIGIVLRDPQGQVISINPALEKILGYIREEYVLQNKYFLQLDDSPEIRGFYQELAAGRRDFFIAENRAFHKEGRPVWGRVHASKVKGKDDQTWFTLSLIEDITREKETRAEIQAYQERLRSLAGELTTTEERERRRLATYLHDNIGQVLALLQIKLGSLRRDLTSKKMAADLDEGRRLLTQIISATRSLTMEMGLSVLHELGFVAGLEWLGEKFQDQNGFRVEVHCGHLPGSLNQAREIFLFRAVRELLTNVTKHAGANNVTVATSNADGQFSLQVSDDGVGFEVSHLTQATGFGLFSIAEQVSNQGGNMDVTSAPGQGTRVAIVFFTPENS